jgi:predicted PurR-regulated permease PerM
VHEPPVASTRSAPRSRTIGITVPTLVVITAFAGLVWALIALRPIVLTLFFALFAALVLEPVVRLTQRKLKLGRGAAATIVVLSLVAVALVIVLVLVAPFVHAMRNFVDSLPTTVEQIRASRLGVWVDAHTQAGEQTQAHVYDFASAVGCSAV